MGGGGGGGGASESGVEDEHSLPEIRLRPATATATAAAEEVETQQDNNNNEECRTPTSDEHKIPVMRSCPPAPKKQRRVISCKRKLLDELRFFEIVGREEIESFFRSSTKKRCCSNSNFDSKSNVDFINDKKKFE
ncbi:cyclin-dependent protein kinase inhibitor SMR2-like [Telopea speciosissima]|uniref:cyclin-dependent protein kinase inhibitor SMR2-like n=1 Tax=Telopea speciosissima TaxID=54955 RepID=UPI001CC5C161|nr:cyclin-dependent protein kinase inhibitor SMR2-like [Telopea speciosissima]